MIYRCKTNHSKLQWLKTSHLFFSEIGNLGRVWWGQDPLEKEMAIFFSISARRIPRTEKPGGLQSMGSLRVRHNWATNTFTFTFLLVGAACLCFMRSQLGWSNWWFSMSSMVWASPHSHLGAQVERNQSPWQEPQPNSRAGASINSAAVCMPLGRQVLQPHRDALVDARWSRDIPDECFPNCRLLSKIKWLLLFLPLSFGVVGFVAKDH